ncbi:8085_t:CDS:2 [Racocetra fulgida]|uniref:8085_t:CDS:1 n=1 Tax=Racocetra fulgida TaxID=60492 RepID=A0A9N9AZT4_9GLOM|nr:8085_t:CDS:2 [Racocetra fulgida]
MYKKIEYGKIIEAETQLTVIQDQRLSVKLADGHEYYVDNIKDLIVYQGKGRPATKRLKAFNEENSKADSSKMHQNIREKRNDVAGICKCRLCHEIRHYASKCPNT